MSFDIPQWISTIGGLVGLGGLVPWLGNRHHQVRDKLNKQRIDAFRDVFAAIGQLRSTGNQLDQNWDWNTPPSTQSVGPTVDALKRAYEVVEQQRNDTGAPFAEAALFVVEFWDRHVNNLWERDYRAELSPPLANREALLLQAIPDEFRKQVAPGFAIEKRAS